MPNKNDRRLMQRCGRYEYQRVLMHPTNPDHLVPSTPSLTYIPPLPVTPRYWRDDGSTTNELPRRSVFRACGVCAFVFDTEWV